MSIGIHIFGYYSKYHNIVSFLTELFCDEAFLNYTLCNM